MLLVYDVHVHVYSGTSIIRKLYFVPVVSTLEGLHCKCFLKLNVHCKCLSYSLRRIDGPYNKTVLVAIQAECMNMMKTAVSKQSEVRLYACT